MVQSKVILGERLNCLRCGYEWLPRQELIVICPKCKSPYWNIKITMKKKRPDAYLSEKDKFLKDNKLEE